MQYLAAALIAFATPALAGVDAVVDNHVLPGYAAFADETAHLMQSARQDCTSEALRPAYQSAFDAWMKVSHLRMGPVEDGGRALAIAFWPDSRGLTEKTLHSLVAEEDPIAKTPDDYSDVSVAARGLFALDWLLYDDDLSGYAADSYSCTLAIAIATDLAGMARDILSDWQGSYAETLRTAGAEGNQVFLSEREAAQALFTALLSGLEFTADQRLGRPMGTFDRPRPTRAEAWRSGRSLRDVILSLEALRDLTVALSDETPTMTLSAFDAALDTARELDDPILAGVATPQGRFDVEILQQRVRAIRQAAQGEIGPALGVAAGFNSADGD